jgi:competence protein ComEA
MDLTKREKIGLIIFISIILIVISVMYFNKNKNDSVEVLKRGDNRVSAIDSVSTKTQVSGDITVDISGEIKKPGVYSLKDGSRADKLVELAGGFTNNADASNVNLAMKLKDEDFIRIPSKIQSSNGLIGTNGTTNTTLSNGGGLAAKININTATLEQLKELPRIGDAMAQRIIDYREKTGFFKDIKNITDVSGIGPKMFENVKDKITVH